MTMYAGIFIGDYAKSMAFKEHNSSTSMSQMELLRKKEYKILCDLTVQCNSIIEDQRQDIVVIDKTKKEVKIVYVTVPGDVQVSERKAG